MKLSFSLLLVLSTMCFGALFSQNYNFGKVSKGELSEKYYASDSTVNAAVLYRKEDVSFFYTKSIGWVQNKKISMRIKIYNKDGFDWASKKVYIYKGDRVKERFKGLKAVTYNLESNKIVKTKLKSNGVFDEQVSKNRVAKSFTMPNVKEGSVVEYQYTITTPTPIIDDIEFQFSIPIKKIDVRVAAPVIYRYKKHFNHKAYHNINYTESIINKTITIDATSGGVDYKDYVTKIEEVNIPALKAESFSGNLRKYQAKLSFELEAILDLDGILRKSFSTNWERVSKTIYDTESFGGQISKSSFYKDQLASVIGDAKDPFVLGLLVEKFVKNKVKWNGNYGFYTQQGIRKAYKEGEGNVADINLLVVSMLKSLGVNANPVLLSTRNNGVPLFPSSENFNYVICAIRVDGKTLLIDATEPFSSLNVLPLRVLNWKGRLIRENGSSMWINLENEVETIDSKMLNIKIDENFEVSGTVNTSYSGYNALNYRKRFTGMSDDDHIKSLEKNKNDIEISNLSFKNSKDISKPVKISYKYSCEDCVEEIGDKLYINPLLFFTEKENPFKLDSRIYPVDFIVEYEDKFIVNIAIPEGYKVDFLPQNEAVQFKENAISYKYLAKQNGNYLQFMINLKINQSIVLPTDYAVFKSFYSKVIEKQNEQIVLSKI